MTKLDIEYTLFDIDGMPLRTKLSPSLQQHQSADDLAKLSDKHSPDMTPLRQVAAGDTQPLMCRGIYGDCGYDLRVASFNGLNQFHEQQPG